MSTSRKSPQKPAKGAEFTETDPGIRGKQPQAAVENLCLEKWLKAFYLKNLTAFATKFVQRELSSSRTEGRKK